MAKEIKIGNLVCKPGTKSKGYLLVGESPSHSNVQIPIVVINGIGEGPTLCLTGGIHGTEYAGMVSILNLLVVTNPKDLNGTLIGIPVVNVTGFQARQYTCFVDGQNTSRSFPGDPTWGGPETSISFRTAHTISRDVYPKIDYELDLHGGGLHTLETVDNCLISWTGNEKVDKEVDTLSKCFPAKFRLVRPLPSRLGASTYALSQGIPALTAESGRSYMIKESSMEFFAKGVNNVMKYLKMIEGTPEKYPEPKEVLGLKRLRAKHGGFFLPKVKVGTVVSEGEVVGEVKNLHGETVDIITAPEDGVVYIIFHKPPVFSGDTVMHFGCWKRDEFTDISPIGRLVAPELNLIR
ncbi:MAG: succinylglutamate desuccinylase/aspartoacylase family protein [Candidatus Hodarchaeota archaeon]